MATSPSSIKDLVSKCAITFKIQSIDSSPLSILSRAKCLYTGDFYNDVDKTINKIGLCLRTPLSLSLKTSYVAACIQHNLILNYMKINKRNPLHFLTGIIALILIVAAQCIIAATSFIILTLAAFPGRSVHYMMNRNKQEVR